MRVANRVLPFAAVGAAVALAVGMYYALFASPPDYQQGDTVRIMYIHVPSAYLGTMIYAVMALGSASALIWRHPLGEIMARAVAPIGCAFTFVCLVTGSLWGKPMWGTWWVWDARLTSVLILFFLYLGYMALANAFDDPARGNRPAGILALVGAVNLPIIKFSVDWWNTLHQPSSLLRMGGPTIAPEMLTPLLWMLAAFTLFFIAVGIVRLRAEMAAQKIRNLQLGRAMGREAA